MLLVFTTPNCSKCVMTKFQLKQNNIEFEEVFVQDNMDLVDRYSVSSGGTIVDDELGEIVELIDVLKGVK